MPEEKQLSRFVRIYYIAGAAGFILPYTEKLFMLVTPIGLLLNLAIVVYAEQWHTKKKREKIRLYGFLAGVYLFTFLTEMAGVQTGKIFGTYTYLHTLGIQVGETPLIIGANWILVFLGASRIVQALKHPLERILMTAFLMTALDWLIEQVAPVMGMWEFRGDAIPLQNYLAWFVISAFIATAKELTGIRIHTGISRLIFICQVLFFAAIFLTHIILNRL